MTKVNSTLSDAVVTLETDLTLLETNVIALEDLVENELTILQETVADIDDRLQQLELAGSSNVYK